MRTSTGAESAWRGLYGLADWRGPRPTGAQLADHLSRDSTALQYALAIRHHLHDIVVLAEDGARPVLEDAAEFITRLSPALLGRVLSCESDEHRRVEFLQAAAARLALSAVLRIGSSLSAVYDRPFVGGVRACVVKMAHRSLTPGEGGGMEAMLRRRLAELYMSWTAPAKREVTPGFEPVTEKMEPRPTGRTVPEAQRLIETAIECDSLGDAVWMAVHEILEDGGIGRVVDMMRTAPEDSAAAAGIMKRVGTAQELRALIRREPFDGAAVDVLLRGMGLAAAAVLLEELVESQQRLTRRYLMERLARLGPEIRPLVEGRLKDQRWFVQRNMLALLRAAKCPADPQITSKFIQHKDARVRREAVLWALESTSTRDEAIAAAIGDRDASVMRPGLQAARSHMPGAAVPVLAKRILDPDYPPEFRVLGLHLLARSGSVLALEALLHYAQSGRTLLGKPKLASKSPEMLAAVAGLARSWSSERRAAVLLEQARRSRDAEVVQATRTASEEAAA